MEWLLLLKPESGNKFLHAGDEAKSHIWWIRKFWDISAMK